MTKHPTLRRCNECLRSNPVVDDSTNFVCEHCDTINENNHDRVQRVSYSELAAGRHCHLKHHLLYRERWVNEKTSPALAKGTAWHLVMQVHYEMLKLIQNEARAEGFNPTAASGEFWVYSSDDENRVLAITSAFIEGSLTLDYIKQVVISGVVPEVLEGIWEASFGFDADMRGLLGWMYNNHVRKYGFNSHWTVLAVEWAPSYQLPHPGGWPSEYELKAKIDLVVLDLQSGYVIIIDHKSGERMPSDRALEIDDQFGLYVWLLRQMGKQVLMSYMAWAGTKQTKSGEAFNSGFAALLPLSRTNEELDAIALDAWKAANTLYSWDYRANGDPHSTPDSEWCVRRCSSGMLSAHLADRQGIQPLRAFLAETGWTQLHDYVTEPDLIHYNPEPPRDDEDDTP